MSKQETLRQQIMEELERSLEPVSLQELSRLVSVSEKELVPHFPHIEKSVKRNGKKLEYFPAACRKCGFEFSKREDPRKPSKCPSCRSEYISLPLFRIV